VPKKRSDPAASSRHRRKNQPAHDDPEPTGRSDGEGLLGVDWPTTELRTEPVQRRAKATVAHILDTAATMLDEVGVDAFNTNLLAERAGVRVRTVYRYFPNKVAVLAALADRLGSAERSFLEGFAVVADPTVGWEQAVDSIIDGYVRGTRHVVGLAPIRRAACAMPELRIVEERLKRVIADGLAAALRKRGVRLPRSRMEAMTRMLVEATTVTMDMARDGSQAYSQRYVRELKTMLAAYMSTALR